MLESLLRCHKQIRLIVIYLQSLNARYLESRLSEGRATEKALIFRTVSELQ